jgi:hypothetical protein
MQVISSGSFNCPRCLRTTRYNTMKPRQWFTLFFIPVFPFREKENHVHCTSCESDFFPEVLRNNQISSFEERPVLTQNFIPEVVPIASKSLEPSSYDSSKLGLSSVKDSMDLPHLYRLASDDGELTESLSEVMNLVPYVSAPDDMGKFHYAIKPLTVGRRDGALMNELLLGKQDHVSYVKPLMVLFYEHGVHLVYGEEQDSFLWSEIRRAAYNSNKDKSEEEGILIIGFNNDIETGDLWVIKDDVLAFCMFGLLAKMAYEQDANIKITEL